MLYYLKNYEFSVQKHLDKSCILPFLETPENT